jgi:hypothetical protein
MIKIIINNRFCLLSNCVNWFGPVINNIRLINIAIFRIDVNVILINYPGLL